MTRNKYELKFKLWGIPCLRNFQVIVLALLLCTKTSVSTADPLSAKQYTQGEMTLVLLLAYLQQSPEILRSSGSSQDKTYPILQQWGGNCCKPQRESAGSTTSAPSQAFLPSTETQPPPEEPDEDEDKEYTALLKHFQTQLDIAKKRSIVMVFNTDLDRTFSQFLLQFEGFNAELEQGRMLRFHQFHEENKENLILVYNTARPPVNLVRNTSDAKRGLSLQRTENFSGTTEPGMVFWLNDDKKALLPMPDFLILGQGKLIEARDTSNSVYATVRSLNLQIQQWTREDQPHLESLHTSLHSKFCANPDICRTSLLADIEKSSGITDASIEDTINQRMATDSSPNASLAYVQLRNAVERVHGALATVNKGTSFRIVMKKIIIPQYSRGKPRTTFMVFVAGDDLPDLPMLIPPSEIEAHGKVTPEAIKLRDDRLLTLDVSPLAEDSTSWWALSLIPTGSPLRRPNCCGEVVRQALSNEKVVKMRAPGIMPFIEHMTKHLKKHLQESDPGIPDLPPGSTFEQ